MKIETREWGTIEVAEESTVHFQDGLIGFEELRDFVFIDAEEFRPFVWFLSIDDPDVGFAVADPFYFSSAPYDLRLSPGDEQTLDLDEVDSVAIFVIVTIEDRGRRITGNLKGPIVLNTRNRLAKQLVVYGSSFSVCQAMLSRRIVPLQSAVGSGSSKIDAAA